jgi:HEAT repeat protein
MEYEIDKLKADMFSADFQVVKNAAETLGKIGGDDVLEFLISLLEVDDPSIRNRAALALEDIKDNRALDPLLRAIFKKENHNSNGTMVFALQALDCSKYLIQIFRILLFETYESKLSAYHILRDQEFCVRSTEVFEITLMWRRCKLSPGICPGYDHDETREMMEDAVQRFVARDTN